jgi:hypothetical protein
VECIYWLLLMPHEHPARALVELMEIGKTPSGPDPVLQHAPETFDQVKVVTTPSWQEIQPKLLVPVSEGRRECGRAVSDFR